MEIAAVLQFVVYVVLRENVTGRFKLGCSSVTGFYLTKQVK